VLQNGGTMDCFHCNEVHNKGTRYCPKTGKSLSDVLFCLNCGKAVETNWATCPSCNFVLKDAPPENGIKVNLGDSSYWFWVIISLALVLTFVVYSYIFSMIIELPFVEEVLSMIRGLIP
jgi:RNA polymerase subunit RPABC4/transcription elongation factor Spt4